MNHFNNGMFNSASPYQNFYSDQAPPFEESYTLPWNAPQPIPYHPYSMEQPFHPPVIIQEHMQYGAFGESLYAPPQPLQHTPSHPPTVVNYRMPSPPIQPPPPPPSDQPLPPPPPEAAYEYADAGVDGDEYNPEKADDDMEDIDAIGIKELEQQKKREQIEQAIREQNELEEKLRLRELREREEHDKRVEAENKKKRKAAGARPVFSSKLKRVELSAFGDDDEQRQHSLNVNNKLADSTNLTGVDTEIVVNNTSGSTSVVSGSSRDISEEDLQVIIRTATWVVNNEDKLPLLIENSKNNVKLKFLLEKESVAGLRYLEELQKLRTQKRVQEVCFGSGPDSGSNYVQQMAQTSSLQEEAQRAVREIALARLSSMGVTLPLTAVSSFGGSGSGGFTSQQTLSTPAAPPTTSLSESTNPLQTTSSNTAEDNSTATGARRERKNRWGPAPTPSSLPVAASIVQQPGGIVIPGSDMVVVPPVMDARMQAQIREQKELQMLESRIREAAAREMKSRQSLAEQEQELFQERLWQYEELAKLDDEQAARDSVEDAEMNGGVIEGGSWEHRKRAKEMLATATKNLQLTMLSAGKHHIADFLPKEELDKFLKRADAVTTGKPLAEESDFIENKIDESNVGYQLLRKAGWTVGEGIGADSTTSIAEPLNMAHGLTENAGIGVHATHEVESEDTAFDQYRKRMMLAYRFRPNPLNNPRRDYY